MSFAIRYFIALAVFITLGAGVAHAEPWQERVFVQPSERGNPRKDILLTRPDGTQWQMRPGMGCRAALMLGSEDPDEQYSGPALVRASAGNPFNNNAPDNYDFFAATLLLPQSPLGNHAGEPIQCRILSLERVNGLD